MENIQYTFVSICSKDRDRNKYPSTSQFTIVLPHAIRNVVSIELVDSVIPNTNSVTNEPYLALAVQELEGAIESLDASLSRAVALLYTANVEHINPFIHTRQSSGIAVKYYNTVKSSLGKFSVSVLDEEGLVFDFGADNGGSILKTVQTTFIFKIGYKSGGGSPV